MIAGFLATGAFLLVRYIAMRSRWDALKSALVASVLPCAIVLVISASAAVWGWRAAPAASDPPPTADAGLRGNPEHSAKLRLNASALARLTAASGAAAAGYIDSFNGISADADARRLHFPRGTTIVLRGWAGDASRRPAAALVAVVDGKVRTDITPFYDQRRVDVARAFGQRSMEFSGFDAARVSTRGLARGRHSISLGIVRRDGTHYDRVPQVRWFELL